MADTAVNCIAAYNSISINADGTIEPCCQFRRDKKDKPLRFTEFDLYQSTVQQSMHQDARAGVRHPGCRKCWAEEDSGWKTLRNWFDQWYQADASSTVDFDNPIYDVELRLGNFCNLKCIMCSQNSSSSISAERAQHAALFKTVEIDPTPVENNHYWETEEFWQFSEKLFKDARRVNITGGEPFIIPEVIKIIDRLLPKKHTVRLSFNTNLTRVSDKLIDRLAQFSRLAIMVSLEGAGDMNDYLRYPSCWNDLLENLQKIKTQVPQAHITVNHTFQHSSIYALPGLIDFCQQQSVKLTLTSVQGNERLTINSVAPADMQQFKNWVSDTDAIVDPDLRRQILNFVDGYVYNSNLHKQYHDYVMTLDQIRGTDYYAVFDTETKYLDNQ